MSEEAASQASSPAPEVVVPTSAPEAPEKADTAKEPSAETPQKVKLKRKIKIDGIEKEEELDEDTIWADYRKWKAADKRFQESSEQRKQNEAFAEAIKNKATVYKALQQAGHDPYALAEELLTEKIQYDMMTPEQKEAYNLKIENYQLKKEKEFRDKEAEDKAFNELSSKNRAIMQESIIEALKESSLPKSPETVRKMARIMKTHLERSIGISFKEAAEMAEREITEESRAILSKLPAEKLIAILGDDVANMIRKHDLSKIKNPMPTVTTPVKNEMPNLKQKKSFTTQSEFEKHMEGIRGRR